MSELEMQNLAIWCNRCLGALTKCDSLEEVIEISVNWGLCWPILRAMWAHLGAMLAHLGAMWAQFGAMLAHLGAMLAHLGRYVGLCWGYVGPS